MRGRAVARRAGLEGSIHNCGQEGAKLHVLGPLGSLHAQPSWSIFALDRIIEGVETNAIRLSLDVAPTRRMRQPEGNRLQSADLQGRTFAWPAASGGE